jgi:hypothetical protein
VSTSSSIILRLFIYWGANLDYVREGGSGSGIGKSTTLAHVGPEHVSPMLNTERSATKEPTEEL